MRMKTQAIATLSNSTLILPRVYTLVLPVKDKIANKYEVQPAGLNTFDGLMEINPGE
jgi:hypothetical protein